jgi:uncharacterized membrane protein YbhN (UPF0104 family)
MMARLGPRARKVLRYAITALVVAAVAVLFARALSDNWAEVVEADLGFHPLYLAATVVFALAVPVSGLLWGAIVNRLAPDRHVGIREAIAVHCSSWLLKYIPGQVGSFLNKVVWGQRRGYSRTLMAVTFLYENIFLQIASIVPSVVIILVTVGVGVFQQNPVALALPLLALVPLILVLHPGIFRRLLDLATRRLLKQPIPPEYTLRPAATATLLTGFVLPRIINGIGFVWIAATVAEVGPGDWLYLAAAYTLAGAIGILAVFVPSGLGVREAVVFVLLVAIGIPAGQAVIISLLARLLSTVADGLIALIYAGLRLSLRKDDVS